MNVTADARGTRARIQDVAVELFTEQGYEKTSLREIAERLGVTKAALYYHFKSKEEILSSLLEDLVEALDALVAWSRTQQPGPALRRELVRRYADALYAAGHHRIMRLVEANQTVARSLSQAVNMRNRLMEMLDLLTTGVDSPAARVKISMAIFALHSTWFVLSDASLSDDERRATGLEVAMELIDSVDGTTTNGTTTNGTTATGTAADRTSAAAPAAGQNT